MKKIFKYLLVLVVMFIFTPRIYAVEITTNSNRPGTTDPNSYQVYNEGNITVLPSANDDSASNTIGSSDSNNKVNNSSNGSKRNILSLPITSDNIFKYFIGLLLSLFGIIAIVIYFKKRKKEKNEENI